VNFTTFKVLQAYHIGEQEAHMIYPQPLRWERTTSVMKDIENSKLVNPQGGL